MQEMPTLHAPQPRPPSSRPNVYNESFGLPEVEEFPVKLSRHGTPKHTKNRQTICQPPSKTKYEQKIDQAVVKMEGGLHQEACELLEAALPMTMQKKDLFVKLIEVKQAQTNAETDIQKKFDCFIVRMKYVSQLGQDTGADCIDFKYEGLQDLLNLVNPDMERASPYAKGIVKKSFDFDTEEQLNIKLV